MINGATGVVGEQLGLAIDVERQVGTADRGGSDQLAVDEQRGRATVGGHLNGGAVDAVIAVSGAVADGDVMPGVIAQIAAQRSRERQILADVEDEPAGTVDRDGRATPEFEPERVARVVLGVQRIGEALRLGRPGILPEHHLCLAGGLLIAPQAVQHRVEAGVGGGIRRTHEALVEQRRAGIELHGIERGGGPLAVGIDVIREGQAGGRRQGHGVGGGAIEAWQLLRRQPVAGQKGLDTTDLLAADQIVQPQGIGIEIAAAGTVHGGAVGPIGLQAPGPAPNRIALSGGDRGGIDQAQAGGVVGAELQHLEGALQQPAVR